MTTKQLQHFLEVYRCSSISKASRNLYISRSSLISSINALEEELGQPLFERTHNGITPTKFGKVASEAAFRFLDIYDSLLDEASAMSKKVISISTSHVAFIPIIISKYINNTDGAFHLHYLEKGCSMVYQDVIEGRSEIGIVATPTMYRDILQQFFRQHSIEHHIICVTPNHCTVGTQNQLIKDGADTVSLADLASMHRIMYHGESTPEKEQKNAILLPPIPLPSKGPLYISDRSSLAPLLENTNSYYLSASYPNKGESGVKTRLRIRDFDPTTDTIWFKKSNRKLKPIIQKFLLDVYAHLGETPDPSTLK